MSTLQLDVYTCPMRDLPNGGQFSPTTSTIVLGPTEAALIDAQYVESDVEEIARRIETSGRALTTIYVTHAHPDHYFGIDWLLQRFPDARAVAHPVVAAQIGAELATHREEWRGRFDGASLDCTVVPEALQSDVFQVDGEDLRVILVGQADIANNTIVQIPSIDAVVAGDVVYNGINPFLAASGPSEWPQWIASVEAVAALNPRVVVAGHKKPELPDDDLAASIAMTRAYVADFIAELDASSDSRDLVARMQRRYPDHGNPSALVLSAVVAWKRKKATGENPS